MASTLTGRLLLAALLLLLAYGRLAGGSGDTAAAAAAAAKFDYKLCKERLCLVNKGCSTINDKDLEPHTEDKQCKILLAIWPYSEKKWLVTVQVNIATKAIHLKTVDNDSKQIANLVTCGINSNGDKALSGISPPYSAVLISNNSQVGSFFYCDFFLITSLDMIPLERNVWQGSLQLKYGAAATDVSSREIVYLLSNLHHYKYICDPDQIKFYQSAANPGQRLAPVNADQFTLTCPDGYDLMYYDGPVARKVSMIKCTASGEELHSAMLYNYQITPPYGVGKVTVIPRDRDLYAFCAEPCPCGAQ